MLLVFIFAFCFLIFTNSVSILEAKSKKQKADVLRSAKLKAYPSKGLCDTMGLLTFLEKTKVGFYFSRNICVLADHLDGIVTL